MNTELSPCEDGMLEQAFRFGFGLPELASVIPSCDPARALDVLDSLAAKRYLGQACLYGNRQYYFLAERMLEEFDVAANEIGPLKEPEKLRRYAMLRFCLESAPPHRPLTTSDFEQFFPELFHAHPTQQPHCRDYYYTGTRLGCLRVDRGGSGHYERVLKNALSHLGKLSHWAPYSELIACGALELAIVTAFATKARRLQAQGYPRVKALFGGLELYEFSLDPEVVGSETYLRRA